MAFRGVSIIAGVIFLALTITATAVVYQAGIPAIEKLQETAAVDKMKVSLSELDDVIRNVAGEGRGSKRTITIVSDPGTLTINGSTDTITWELETASPSITPRTSQKFGNLVVGANLKTSVAEGSYTRVTPPVTAFVMENEHLLVYINRTGSPTNKTPIKTNSLLLAIYNKDLDSWLENPGFLEISIDNEANSRTGQGYTRAVELGNNLPFGEIEVLVDNAYVDYIVDIILETGADFLTIEAQEA